MATMRDIVTRAFRKIGVGGSGEAIEAEQSAEGIDALNSMLHEWKLSGVDVSHSDLSLSATFPLDAEYERGTVYLLAQELSPDFERPQGFDADDFFRRIQAAYLSIDTVSFDKAVYRVPSQLEGELEASDA